jgi:hypothetical protein
MSSFIGLGYILLTHILHICRLLHMGYGLLGLNNIPLKGGNRSQFSCVFVDPNGSIKEICVPFHFALRYVSVFLLSGLSVLVAVMLISKFVILSYDFHFVNL